MPCEIGDPQYCAARHDSATKTGRGRPAPRSCTPRALKACLGAAETIAWGSGTTPAGLGRRNDAGEDTSMRKTLVVALALAMFAAPAAAQSKQQKDAIKGTGRYGAAGCGLGSLAF